MSLVLQILILLLLLTAVAVLVALLFLILDLRENAKTLSFILKDIEKKLPTILDSLEKSTVSIKEISTNVKRDFGSLGKIVKTVLNFLPIGSGKITETLMKKGILYSIGLGIGFGLWEGIKKKSGKEDKDSNKS